MRTGHLPNYVKYFDSNIAKEFFESWYDQVACMNMFDDNCKYVIEQEEIYNSDGNIARGNNIEMF